MVFRNTRQRQLVMDAVLQCDKGAHLSADSIYQIVKQHQPNISLGTVYRNLDTLCNMGVITRIKHGNLPEYYDKETHLHYHFYCEKCGQISDVEMQYIHELDDKLRGKDGYKVSRHRLVFEGICGACAPQ